jgi:hypothetical protein
MIQIPLPLPSTELLLSPRWSDLPWAMKTGTLILCVLPPLLVFWLYRYEMRLIKRSTANILLTLRLVVLAFLLFIVVFQPIVVRTTTEELPGRVMIAVDRSDSMAVTDPQRSEVDKLRLARALKLVGEDVCPRAQLDAWIKQYEAKGDKATLDFAGLDEFPNDPQKRREAIEKRRAQFEQVCQVVDQLTRDQAAQRVLGDGVRLLPAITEKHAAELLGFTQQQWEVKPEELEQLFKSRPTPALGTDLGLPLSRALERSGPDRGKLLGIVVLTDGQHNWDDSPVARAAKLGDLKMPVYPIALGARQSPPSIAIARLKAPPAVFKDVDIDVEAGVLITGLPAGEIIVELERPGSKTPLIERIKHDGRDRTYPVHFETRLDQVGAQALKVTAKMAPGAVQPKTKVRTDLSSRSTKINVADDKAKVLLIDGEARYEFHYLASALLRDRTMQVSRVVFNQPRIGKVPEDELKKLGNPSLTMPVEPDALAGYDCIVLGDVSSEQLPPPERARLEKYVADRGGTLVILAGKRAMPIGFTSGPATARDADPLVKLLPIEKPRPFDSTRGFAIRLTDEGERVQFLRMEDGGPDKSRERWAALPPHYWGIIGEAKPGAVPLASFTEEGALLPNPKEKPATSSDDPARKKALIVRQNYGFGRVLYVGIDSTWRWRKYVGDKYHHRFWGQVIRWAASDKPLVTGNEQVRFGTREPVYDQGQEVDVVVRLAEDVPPLSPESRAGARILRLGEGDPPSEEAVALVPLKARPAQPRVLEGRVRDLPAGQYRIELAIPELADKLIGPSGPDGQPGKLRAPFSVSPRDNPEMLELATNWQLLQELATRSGGKVFTPENAAELGDLLQKKVDTHLVPTERKLWQEWGTLALFLLLLTGEWVGRKLAGLP